MRVIFLDIDGVLNDHVPHENGYLGTKKECVRELNRLLTTFEEAKLVLSSAWRYAILKREMNRTGFEFLLMSHGVDCARRIVGTTGYDRRSGWVEVHDSYADRARLIKRWARRRHVTTYVALDDLPLPLERLVQTDPAVGLTAENVQAATRMLLRGEGNV